MLAKTLWPFPSTGQPLAGPMTSLPNLRAQVDGEEVLGNQTLVPHVVKDRCGTRGSDAGIGQTQDAVEGRVVQERARLGLAQTEDLVGVGDASDLRRGTQDGHDQLVLSPVGHQPWAQSVPVSSRVGYGFWGIRLEGGERDCVFPQTLVFPLEVIIVADLQMVTLCAWL